jgi:hypothetical protein
MKFVRLLLTAFANAYHLMVTGFLGGVGVLAWLSDTTSVKLEFLPWTGEELVKWLIVIGITGFIACALHISGKFPYLLPLTSLALAILLFRGFFWLPFQFDNAEQFYWVAALVAGAFGAFLSSLAILRKKA